LLSYRKHAGEKKRDSSMAAVYGSILGEMEARLKALKNTQTFLEE
jgi:ribosome-binding factor A